MKSLVWGSQIRFGGAVAGRPGRRRSRCSGRTAGQGVWRQGAGKNRIGASQIRARGTGQQRSRGQVGTDHRHRPRPRTLTHCLVSTLHALQPGLSGAGRLERLKAMKRTLSIAMGALAIWALMVVAFTQPSANAGPTCTPVGPGLPSQVCTCDLGSHWDAFPGVCEPDADNGSFEPPLLK